MELSSPLQRSARDAFDLCEVFDSNERLRDFMNTKELRVYRNDLEASTRSERIDRCLGRLPERILNGQEVFLLFVDALRQRYPEGDRRWLALERLFAELTASLFPPATNSTVPAFTSNPPGFAQSGAQHRIKIFYSYARVSPDQKMVHELRKHLAILRAKERIDEWEPDMLTAGGQVNAREQILQTADIIALMLSPDYLSDPVLLRESTRALSSRARIIPVLLRRVDDWKSLELGKLLPLPRNEVPIQEWRDRDVALAEVAREMRKVIESLP